MKRIISGFLTLVMLLGSLVVSADAAWADKVNEKGDPIIDYLSKDYATSEDKLADMIFCKEEQGIQILYLCLTVSFAAPPLITTDVVFK